MKNILLIVEGAVTEVKIFQKIAKLYQDSGFAFCFFSYKTNIYQLYRNILEYGKDFVDTIDVLKKTCKTNNDKEILNQKFAYIYLIFDYECQDPSYSNDKILELVDWFDDETDKGLLYLNYPMMESYADHKYFNIYKYFNSYVNKKYLNGKYYKNLVLKRGYPKEVEDYNQTDFEKITYLNVKKAYYILTGKKTNFSYKEFRSIFSQFNILSTIIALVNDTNKVLILNTSIFFLIDYYGKKFFDSLF